MTVKFHNLGIENKSPDIAVERPSSRIKPSISLTLSQIPELKDLQANDTCTLTFEARVVRIEVPNEFSPSDTNELRLELTKGALISKGKKAKK